MEMLKKAHSFKKKRFPIYEYMYLNGIEILFRSVSYGRA